MRIVRGRTPSLLLGALLCAAGLAAPAGAQLGTVLSQQKISLLSGGFGTGIHSTDEFSYGMGSIGDLDGDNVPDVAVGAPWDDDGGTNRGAVWILFLKADGTVKSKQKISDTAGGFLGVLHDDDWFGWSVAAIGDLDGDGVTELGVGAIQTDDTATDSGALWILFMNPNGTVKSHQRISANMGGLPGFFPDFEWFGTSVAALGDQDGDGIPDIAVGAHGDSDTGNFRGAVFVLYLNTDGTVALSQKINEINGNFAGVLHDGDEFGWAVSAVGDLDGDGVGDLAASSNLDDDGGQDRGAVWILFLQHSTSQIVKGQQKISNTSGNFTGVLDNRDHFGRSMAALGDIDGDGLVDLSVGAYQDDDGGKDEGAVWNLFLAADGTVKSSTKISALEGNFGGVLHVEDKFGGSVAALGDLNHDGLTDLAVGASMDDDGGFNVGAVWVLFMDGDTWSKLGNALAGVSGDPQLDGTGTLAAGSSGSIGLTNARPSALTLLFVSAFFNPTPFKGGLLCPVPALAKISLATSPLGEIPLGFIWPSGIPAGTHIYFQYAIQDAAAANGVALSNALSGLTP